MRDISFIDKTFDRTNTESYHLTVQISPDGLIYTLLDIEKGKYILLNAHYFFLKRPRFLLKQVKEMVEKEELLRLKYHSIHILYSTNLFTLVPNSFFQEKDSEKFLSFNHALENGFSIKNTLLSRAEARCIYAIPENLDVYLQEIFPNSTLRHNLFPLLEKSLKDNLHEPKRRQIHLNFFRDFFEMVSIDGSKLLNCNCYSYKNERDILYYVLYVFDQLKLSPEETEIIIHGHLPQVSPVYHLFKKYVRHTFFSKTDNAFQYSYTFNQLPEHYFTSLLNCFNANNRR
jgi:hypothetical protein